jgi:alpha-L-rhamnosidase
VVPRTLGPHGGRRNNYGDRLALLALEVAIPDGFTTVVMSDDAWRAATGPILAADLYDGETHDARLELTGWAKPGYDDRAWHGVRQLERRTSGLVAPTGPAVRRTELVAPVATMRSTSGKLIVDFGQNLVAVRIRLRVTRPTVTLRHAEILEDGALRPSSSPGGATDRYTLRGDRRDVGATPPSTVYYAEPTAGRRPRP